MAFKKKRSSQALPSKAPPSFAKGPPPLAGPMSQGMAPAPMGMKKGGAVRRKKRR